MNKYLEYLLISDETSKMAQTFSSLILYPPTVEDTQTLLWLNS